MKTKLLLLVMIPGPLLAQSTISTTDRYAYSANAGWIDWRADATNGVKATETYLSGYAYAANFGWIHFGDGSPNNGHTYTNASATDYGVNMAVDGKLTGYAYSANAGWIHFEQTQGLPKLSYASGKFSGYAYSANLGWISLDTASSDLATTLTCPDTDADGIGDAYERLHFGNLTTATATTDADGDGSKDAAEYMAGTNPLNASSNLRITAQSYTMGLFGTANLTFTSVPNRLYQIEYNADLQAPWTNSALGTFSPDLGSTTSKTVIHGSGSKKFFRVEAIKPLQ